MLFPQRQTSWALLALAATAATSVFAKRPIDIARRGAPERVGFDVFGKREVEDVNGAKKSKYYNEKTSKFWVNGSAIPDVDFDVGESYAGLIPISEQKDETRELYFWFFPTTAKEEVDDLVIWLNGGPGCSSLEGLLQENGPLSWKSGTYRPVRNDYTWTNLTNMIWVEQPVGTGFSRGVPSATSEADVAEQFLGFFKNFITTFGLQHKKIYVTGESYAGAYVPYIVDGMYGKNDTTHFDVRGLMIYDPVLTYGVVQDQVPAVAYVEKWKDLFALNETTMATLKGMSKQCGYDDFLKESLVYPPKGLLPTPPQAGSVTSECNVRDMIFDAVLLINPCFNVYEITTTCPVLWDVLGFPGSFDYLPPGAQIYFNRTEVQDAINAPHISWKECAVKDVFVNGTDTSTPTALSVLPRLIERNERTIIAHGALDYILMVDGTLIAIQNMTWNGAQGFQSKPSTPFTVPYENQGVLGTSHTERGLTFVEVALSGHMVPGFQPGAAYVQLQYLLGRTEKL